MTKPYQPARLITRPVVFDWSDLPFYWVPGEPFASHAFNMNHFLLPAGEQWFCRVFQEAMDKVEDPALRQDMRLFLKQEANHARAHNEVVDYYATQGIDVTPVLNWIEDWWRENLGPQFFGRELKSNWAKRQWFLYRLGVVAAIEHFTCVLGKWMLETDGFEKANANPQMMDLLRWHGAEEIEHRAVAHNLLRHLGGGSLPGRVVHMASALIFMGKHMTYATKFMLEADKEFQPISIRAEIKQAQAKNLLPKTGLLLKAIGRFIKPGYHPDHEASLEEADRYLSVSPAVAAGE